MDSVRDATRSLLGRNSPSSAPAGTSVLALFGLTLWYVVLFSVVVSLWVLVAIIYFSTIFLFGVLQLLIIPFRW